MYYLKYHKKNEAVSTTGLRPCPSQKVDPLNIVGAWVVIHHSNQGPVHLHVCITKDGPCWVGEVSGWVKFQGVGEGEGSQFSNLGKRSTNQRGTIGGCIELLLSDG